MKTATNFSVLAHNSFAVDANCPLIHFPTSVGELELLSAQLHKPFYVLGEGSNTLFVDDETPVIIKPNLMGIEITEDSESYYVKVGASENWHDLVCYCIERGIYGLENLALIPGSVGASPVQNIGAYGVELSDHCDSVKWFEFSTGTLQTLTSAECRFSYRDSTFKHHLKNKGVIIEVSLCLPKNWRPNLSYEGLNQLSKESSAEQIMQQVIRLRQTKLPDPKETPNAGSFFKNPIIEQSQFKFLIQKYPNLPHYLQGDKSIKLAAGWLIEKSGLKGFEIDGVGVHDKQALVLVNFHSKHGRDIVNLATHIQTEVHKKFHIMLEPEVRMVTKQGELAWDQIS